MRQRRRWVGPKCGGQRQVVPAALDRQQVRLDRLRDQLVPDLESMVGTLQQEPVVDGVHDPGAQVRVQHAVPAPRTGRRARGQAVDEPLEGRRGRRELTAAERHARRRDHSEYAPALRRAAREPSQDQLFERRAEGQPGKLASRREDLLRDQRIAAGSLGDEQERGRGRALAIDLRDEVGEVEPVQRPKLQLRRRIRAARDGRQLRLERMAAGDLVAAVRQHEARTGRARDAGEERREIPGPRVGVLEVLEDQEHRAHLAGALQEALDGLGGPCRAALRRDRFAACVRNLAREA